MGRRWTGWVLTVALVGCAAPAVEDERGAATGGKADDGSELPVYDLVALSPDHLDGFEQVAALDMLDRSADTLLASNDSDVQGARQAVIAAPLIYLGELLLHRLAIALIGAGVAAVMVDQLAQLDFSEPTVVDLRPHLAFAVRIAPYLWFRIATADWNDLEPDDEPLVDFPDADVDESLAERIVDALRIKGREERVQFVQSNNPANRFEEADGVYSRYVVALQAEPGATRNDVEWRARDLAREYGTEVAWEGGQPRVFSETFQGFTTSLMRRADAVELAERPDVRYVSEVGVLSLYGDDTDAHIQSEAEARNAVRTQAEEAELEEDDDGCQTNAPWNLDRIDQCDQPLDGKYCPPGTGAGVNVYVIDTGVMGDVASLASRVLEGFNARDDGRTWDDCDGHGTQVASIAGGTASGVAKGATIIPVRVLNCRGAGENEDIISGIEWMLRQHKGMVPFGATELTGDDVIRRINSGSPLPSVANMSLGGEPEDLADWLVVEDAVLSSIRGGITFVVASGNSSSAIGQSYPAARLERAVVVGASTEADTPAEFSNWGARMDLFAPGDLVGAVGTVRSLLPMQRRWVDGTSFAAPHVAGAAALYLEQHPTARPVQVEAALVRTAATGRITGVPSGTPNELLYVGTDRCN